MAPGLVAPRSTPRSLVAATLALVLVISGCSDTKDRPSVGGKDDTASECGELQFDAEAPSGGTFVDYASLSDAGTTIGFDPGVVQTLAEAQITTAIFDGLTEFDYTKKCDPVLKGEVAESWEVNDDATEFTFEIGEGEVFSNGLPVLPSNFKLAWERAGSVELASPTNYLIGLIEGSDELFDGTASDLSGVIADDEAGTLSVTLSSPNAEFPAIVTHPIFSPVDTADLQAIGLTTGWGTAGMSIGNGPFMLKSADEEQVVLVPSPTWSGNVYGDTEVKVDELVFMQSTDAQSAYQSFVDGEGSSAPVPPGKVAEAKGSSASNSLDAPNLGTAFFSFGYEDPQVGGPDNVKLRQAISLSIDRQEISDDVFEASRPVATGLAPPGTPGYRAGLCEFCEHDPERARELFDEWVDDGGELIEPIRIDFDAGTSNEAVAQIVQSNVQDALDIELELGGIADEYFVSVAQQGGCQLCRAGWYADAPTYGAFLVDSFSSGSIGGNNLGRFDDPAFDEVLNQAQSEIVDAKRSKLHQRAEALVLNEQTVAVPLTWYTGAQVFREGVVNFDQTPLGLMLWERISVSG